jgi:eukaryotic-like serine/threonine-protein kinase
LWRSRSDGTERLQLTYSPARVAYPFISPDGRWVSYQMVPDGEDYVISMDGGPPQSIPGKNVWGATWSPDGNVLVFGAWLDRRHTQFQFYDLRTKQSSVVPGPNDLLAVEWIAEGTLVAVSHDRTKILALDVKRQKWSDFVPGPIPGGVINWTHSPDYKYLYYTTGGADPQALRVRLADHAVEAITSLKDLNRAQERYSTPESALPLTAPQSSPATSAPRKSTPSP